MSSKISRLEIKDICDELSEDLRRELIESQVICVSKLDSNRKQFYELKDEIKRLKSDLKFANKCLITLNKFKKYLNEIRPQIENVLDFRQKQELNQLENEYQFMIKTFNDRTQINTSSGSDSRFRVREESDEVVVNDIEGDHNYYIKEEIIESNDYTNANEVSNPNQLTTQTIRSNERIADNYSQNSHQVIRTSNNDKENNNSVSEQKFVSKHSRNKLGNINENDVIDEDIVPQNECQSDADDEEYTPQRKRQCISSTESNKSFVCPVNGCNKRFASTRSRNNHWISSRIHIGLEFDPNLRLECNECNFRCDSNKWMSKHKERHSLYICQFCDKSYQNYDYLCQHLKEIHSFFQQFECTVEECHQSFTSDYHRTIHLKKEHNIVKSYPCDYPDCEFVGKYPRNLENHKLKHTGDKPYPCDSIGCGFSANNWKSLYNHKNSVHNTLPETKSQSFKTRNRNNFSPFVCPVKGCFRRYPSSKSRNRHWISSDKHIVLEFDPKLRLQCNECNFRCDSDKWMKLHKEYHSRRNCQFCDKTFRYHDSLVNHLKKVHSFTQKFECTVEDCQQIFVSDYHRSIHLRREHKVVNTYQCDYAIHKSNYESHPHRLRTTVPQKKGQLVAKKKLNELEPSLSNEQTNDTPEEEEEVIQSTNYNKENKNFVSETIFVSNDFVNEVEIIVENGVHNEDIIPRNESQNNSNQLMTQIIESNEQTNDTPSQHSSHISINNYNSVSNQKISNESVDSVDEDYAPDNDSQSDDDNEEYSDTNDKEFIPKRKKETIVKKKRNRNSFVCPVNGCEKRFPSIKGRNKHWISSEEHSDLVFDSNLRLECNECNFRCDSDDWMRQHKVCHSFHNCHICHKSYRDKRGVTRHLKAIHSYTLKFMCTIKDCHQEFTSDFQRTAHMIRDHKIEKNYPCLYPECEFVAKYSCDLKEHVYDHTGETPYVCDWVGCGFATGKRRELTRHKSRHTSTPEEPSEKKSMNSFVCPVNGCEKSFALLKSRNRHWISSKKHIDLQFDPSLRLECNECNFRCDSDKWMRLHKEYHSSRSCQFCDKTFRLNDTLVHHLKKVHSYVRRIKCSVEGCQQDFPADYLRASHMSRDHNIMESYPCDYPNCDFVGQSKREMEFHNHKHTDETQYVCEWPECGFIAKKRIEMNRHRNEKHDRTFKCELCDKSFYSMCSLGKHKSIHSKPFKCHSCSESFRSRTRLTRHNIDYHSNATIKCGYPNCGQEFSKTCQRTNHINLVHKKKFRCDWPQCNFIADYRQKLVRHKYSHTGSPFVCVWPDCGFVARSRENLIHHRYRHTGERPYPCQWPGCDKCFRTESAFSTHMRLHRNDKCYSCEWPGCEFATHDRSHLRTHRFRHQKDPKKSQTNGRLKVVIKTKNNLIKKSINKRNIRKPKRYETDSDYSDDE